MPFRPLTERVVRWAPVEGDGLEHLTVTAQGESIVASSVVIGQRGGRAYGAQYRIVCDAAWRVRQVDLRCTDRRNLHLRSDGQGHWRNSDGVELRALDGCMDVDLAGTPFTNTLPIRRLALRPERGAVELTMLYVRFDDFLPVADGQIYSCVEWGKRYSYAAADGSFTAELPVDEDGLVLDYPGLFRRVTVG